VKKSAKLLLTGALTALPAVLVARAVAFRPIKKEKAAPDAVPVDGDRAVASLAQMIRCKTVSNQEHEKEDEAEFQRFRDYLVSRYPGIHSTCELRHIGRNGLLYRWAGKSSDAPSVFMAHYDVVPADPATWTKPPFGGLVEDGILWGRGALDTKGTLVGVVEAAEQLIGQGFVPENDIYLAFSGEEEISGDSALDIVKDFEARGVKPALVLDEGGAVVEGVFPGVTDSCALIGTGEKGQLFLYMDMHSDGGHASAPPPHSILGRLGRAAAAIEDHPFPFNLTPPAAEMFDTLGRHSTFAYRLIFANLWLFRPVLDLLCSKTGGELNALVRTTTVITQASGSAANNVIPPEASVGVNVRLAGGDTTESAIERLRRVVNDPDITFRRGVFSEASVFSQTGDAPGWQRMVSAVERTWPEAVVSPYLMIAGSDSRHYSRISDHVYRFCPMAMTTEERHSIHGNDEHIAVPTVKKTVQFYVRLMRMC
jgi:carboxypeptidase PM20D1